MRCQFVRASRLAASVFTKIAMNINVGVCRRPRTVANSPMVGARVAEMFSTTRPLHLRSPTSAMEQAIRKSLGPVSLHCRTTFRSIPALGAAALGDHPTRSASADGRGEVQHT